jgi:hypothetical protein
MMVLGDFLKRRIAPLQQRSRMAYMYTGLNDCCRIARGPGADFTRAELESAVRVMTGEVFSPESLVLPSGVKALCEDQALRSSILAAMPTLDEGGLAVRQLGGDPNRGLQIPGATPDRQQRASEGPGEPGPGGPAPAGKGKEKAPVPEHQRKGNPGFAPAQRGEEAQGAAPAQSCRGEGSKSRRLQRGDGSLVGEPAQVTEDGGGGGAKRSSTSSATTPTAGEEAGGGATASSEAADSSTTTADTESGDTTTTNRPQAANPTTAARSTGGREHPPGAQGVLGREEDPPSRPGQMGVVRLHVSNLLKAFRCPS